MRLFVIEGVDGAGKSTQIKLLSSHLRNQGHKTEYLHFPRTETPFFGELIARFLRGEFGTLNEVDPWLVAMLYAGDRKDASRIISNWLDSGTIVILDRYTYSNVAYQCAKVADKDIDRLRRWITELEFGHFRIPKPNLNIFLDVPFSFTEKKLSSARRGKDRDYLNGTKDIHEGSLDFQRRVRDIYLRLPVEESTFAVINCGSSNGEILKPEEIFKKIITLIGKRGLLEDKSD